MSPPRPLSPAQQDRFNRDVVEALEALNGQGGRSERCQAAIERLRGYAYHCRGDCGCATNPYDVAEQAHVDTAAAKTAAEPAPAKAPSSEPATAPVA